MIDRLRRSELIKPARDRTPRCADMVLAGTARASAISPAGRPSGSCLTSSGKVLKRELAAWVRHGIGNPTPVRFKSKD